MKKLLYLTLALAIAGCDFLAKDPVKEETPKENDNKGSEITTPLFPAGSDEVEGIAQPKGAVKSIETSYFSESSTTEIWDKSVQTIIYDEFGRPKREDLIYYNYENGVATGTQRIGSSTYYLYSPGKIEVRTGSKNVTQSIALNSDGLVESADEGYMKDGKWVCNIKWQYSYNAGRCTGRKKLGGSWNIRDTDYDWNNDGSLYSAKEQWNGPANPDEDGSEYYYYGLDNPTYKQAFDISLIVYSEVGILGGYYFNGLGSSKLPTSVKTSFRNDGKVFTYEKATSGQIVKITEKKQLFVDNDPQIKNFRYREYKFSYYN